MTQPAAAGPALALRYDAWFDNPWGRYAWRIETRAVLGALGPLTGRRVADVGCGTGRLLRILTSNGAKAVGLDTDPAMLTLGAATGPTARADAHQLPLADASMDAAITVATLEFTTGPAQVLAEMARVTRPGGRLVAAVLNPASLWGILDQPARRWLAVSAWDVPARARHTGLLADAIAEVTGTPPAASAVPGSRLRGLLHAAGLGHAECSTLRWVHPVPSAQALWDGLLAGPVAAAAAVLRAKSATQRRIRERFLTLAAAVTDPGERCGCRSARSSPPASGPPPAAPAARRVPARRGQPPPPLPRRAMSPPEKAPVVIGGGDRTCTALLLELRRHLTWVPAGNSHPPDRTGPRRGARPGRLVPPHRPRLPRPRARRRAHLRAAHQRRLPPDSAPLALAAHR